MRFRRALLALMMAVTLAACSGDEGDGDSFTPNQEQELSQTPQPSDS